MGEARKRRREEQALADRIGRMFTDPMPLPLLMAMVEGERKRAGVIAEAFDHFDFTNLAGLFWSAFWRNFQAAKSGESLPALDISQYLKPSAAFDEVKLTAEVAAALKKRKS